MWHIHPNTKEAYLTSISNCQASIEKLILPTLNENLLPEDHHDFPKHIESYYKTTKKRINYHIQEELNASQPHIRSTMVALDWMCPPSISSSTDPAIIPSCMKRWLFNYIQGICIEFRGKKSKHRKVK